MNIWKHWIVNGLPVFVSTGVISFKALLDSWLLDRMSQHDLQAFALAFPIIILANTIAVSISNGITGTASKWIGREEVLGSLTVVFLSVALLLGIGVALLLNFLIDPLILWFDAEKYRTSLQAFCETSYFWLPFQFALAVQCQIARYIGLFKSSSFVITVCCLLGMLLSYYLLSQHTEVQPLSAVVLANSAIALSSSVILLVQLAPRLSWGGGFKTLEKIREILAQGGEVFYTTLLSQSLAVVFIFVIIQQFAQYGEDIISLLAYITRIEQLILMLAFSFISVMLPDVARVIENRGTVRGYIRQASLFLILCGTLCALISLSVILAQISFEGSDSERLSNMLLIAGLWFFGTVVQGGVVFFSQLINVILSPKSAVVLNFVRFVMLGVPFVYIGGAVANEIGIAVALACLHFASWPIYYRKVNQLLPT